MASTAQDDGRRRVDDDDDGPLSSMPLLLILVELGGMVVMDLRTMLNLWKLVVFNIQPQIASYRSGVESIDILH